MNDKIPDGYYRDADGMLQQETNHPAPQQTPIDLAAIEGMDANALKKLIQKVYKAGWGYGGLTGKDLLEMALKTKDEAYEALKLRAIVLATNATEWREFVALATFWAEREKGKPQQSVDISGKIGIVDIVLEAGRRRNLQPSGDSLLFPPVDNPKIIDNQ